MGYEETHTYYHNLLPKTADAVVKARRESIQRFMSREGNIRLFLH